MDIFHILSLICDVVLNIVKEGLSSPTKVLVGISSPQRIRLVQRTRSLPRFHYSWLDRLPKCKKSVTHHLITSLARYQYKFFLCCVPRLSFVIFITSSYVMEKWYDSLVVLIYISIFINEINIFYISISWLFMPKWHLFLGSILTD